MRAARFGLRRLILARRHVDGGEGASGHGVRRRGDWPTARAGDILWWDSGDAGHTAIYSGDGKLIEAAQDYDGQPGDSGGREIWEHGLYDPGWQKMAHAPASSSGSAAGLYGCAAKAEEGWPAARSTTPPTTARRRSPTSPHRAPSTRPEYQQYCAKWAGDVVDSALGASTSRYGSAYLDFKANAVSTSPTGIPVGAAVYGSGWPTASDGSSTRSATSAYTSATGRSPTTRRSGR